MKISDAAVGLALVLAGYGVTAGAATARVAQTAGRVLVTQTTATVPAQVDMPLSTGDRIAVVGSSAATVVYTNGCSVTMPANSMLTVGGVTQCSSAQAQVQTTQAVTTVDPAKRSRPPGAPLPVEGSKLSR